MRVIPTISALALLSAAAAPAFADPNCQQIIEGELAKRGFGTMDRPVGINKPGARTEQGVVLTPFQTSDKLFTLVARTQGGKLVGYRIVQDQPGKPGEPTLRRDQDFEIEPSNCKVRLLIQSYTAIEPSKKETILSRTSLSPEFCFAADKMLNEYPDFLCSATKLKTFEDSQVRSKRFPSRIDGLLSSKQAVVNFVGLYAQCKQYEFNYEQLNAPAPMDEPKAAPASSPPGASAKPGQ